MPANDRQHDAVIQLMDRFREDSGLSISDVVELLLATAANYATEPEEPDGHSNVAVCRRCFVSRAAQLHREMQGAPAAYEPKETKLVN